MVKHSRMLFALFLPLVLAASSPLIVVAQKAEVETHPPIRTNGVLKNSVVGWSPKQIRHAYGFDQIANQGAGQTIAIVDAYDDSTIEDDLGVFNQTFGLPPCTTNNGCFRKIYAAGKPGVKQTWSLEIALDVEWAHAIAPAARLILIEAKSGHLADMLVAVDLAVQSGASAVSMSWGTAEFAGELDFDNHFVAPNVAFIAASGDFGNPGFYPAASPNVTGVGGTTLKLSERGDYSGEVAWDGSGGGLSVYEVEPRYQALFGIPNNPGGKRGVPDVAFNADPNPGFAVYSSMPFQGSKGWLQVGGASAGAPQWAGLVAIVNSLRTAAGRSPLTGLNDFLYSAASPAKSYSSNYHDVVAGANGTCGMICESSPGYDYVTGIGSPQVDNLIKALVKIP